MERNYASKMMDNINKGTESTAETMALGILLEVQLDIRDQNQKIIEFNDKISERLKEIVRKLGKL